MAKTTEGASEAVEKVRFSFMTDEEVRRHSVVKITNPILLDSLDRPAAGGLYDPAMGPLDEHSKCKSCGQRSFHCPGHCGHIDLVSPVYNPLLLGMLHSLLKRTCFFCFHFQDSREEVANCISQLELIAKGDIIGPRQLGEGEMLEAAKDKKERTLGSASVRDKTKRDAASEADMTEHEDSESSHFSCGTTVYHGTEDCSEHNKQHWDSFRFTEAISVLNKFLKKNPKKFEEGSCSNCNAQNPKIKKTTFGWFHMDSMAGSDIRANIIMGRKFEDEYSSVVVNAANSSWENDLNTAETDSFKAASDVIKDSIAKDALNQGVLLEYEKHKNFFSGSLLPSEVREVVKHLWKNEALLCSFICDIQREQLNMSNTSSKIVGDSMFFLGSILVSPVKFRPAAKGGDAVMEHAHTLLLGKVLQSNIALANAHINNAERSKIVNHWMDLQKSINTLYDSKTMNRQSKNGGTSGICQILEKKEGIFRQKIMGKRVNFACRSVISPDPYLAVNEIGIPPYFALRLTYPEERPFG